VTARLVLLHGFVGGSWSYHDVIASLGSSRELLIPTLTYHEAGSGGLLPNRDFADEIERLARYVAKTGSEPIELVGYSMGGRLALGLAIAHPELVRGLVLLSSRRGLDCPLSRERRRQADEVWADMLEREGLDAFLDRWWTQPIFRTLSRLPAERLRMELEQRRTHRPVGLAAALRHFGLGSQPSYASEVRGLELPVTLVAGELDEKFVSLTRQLATELPQGRCIVVEGAGHHLLLEAPTRVARIIDEEIER
jgi:2-succinyl-6-hydroxy-2,4-cyclohexadiene-1-carboxylate synthase